MFALDRPLRLSKTEVFGFRDSVQSCVDGKPKLSIGSIFCTSAQGGIALRKLISRISYISSPCRSDPAVEAITLEKCEMLTMLTVSMQLRLPPWAAYRS